jgi:subtilase family serine protease
MTLGKTLASLSFNASFSWLTKLSQDTRRTRSLTVERFEERLLLSALGLLADQAEPALFGGCTNVAVQNLSKQLAISNGSSNSIHPQDASSVLFTPLQLSEAYGFNNIFFPTSGGGVVAGDGSGQTIAVVIPYQQPNLVSDLHTFSQAYGLPDANITIVNQSGSTSPSTLPILASGNWGLEASLDVEWVHALAPGANILVVEVPAASNTNLLAGVNTARNAGIGSLAQLPNVSVVSMSWGGLDLAGDMTNAPFSTPAGKAGVTFVAAVGDTGGAGQYPAADPNVLGVGGTTLTTDAQGNYVSESAWSGSNGGYGANGGLSYQQGIQPYGATNNGLRMTPDVSFNAGASVSIYDSYDGGGWTSVGGTSAGAPAWAALLAIADQGRNLAGLAPLADSQALSDLYAMYSNGNYQYAFHDISSGSNASYSAGPGYDLVTGLGSPRADVVAALLAGLSLTPTPSGPSGAITSTTPTFQWSAVAGATGYYLTLLDTTTQQSIASNLSVSSTSYTPSTQLTAGHSYQWQVQAFDQDGTLGTASAPTTFSVNSTEMLSGDANGDGIVNAQDLALISSNWLTSGPVGDVNGDGIVNAQDLAVVASNWLATISSTAADKTTVAKATAALTISTPNPAVETTVRNVSSSPTGWSPIRSFAIAIKRNVAQDAH